MTKSQEFKHVNGFFRNAKVSHNHHRVEKQFTIIRVDARHNYEKWIGETIGFLDKLLVLSHPYLVPLKGFILLEPTDQKEIYLGEKKTFDNVITLRTQYTSEKSVLFFASRQVTNLECLLEEKEVEIRKEKQVTSYLETQFPLFWRVKIAIRFLIAVHFLYKCNYGHHNLDSKFLFFDQYGHARLCPPIQPLPRLSPKEDMHKCGKILKELITGVSRGKEPDIFQHLIDDFLSYHDMDIFKQLERAINDMRLMDSTFSQFLQKYKNGALIRDILSYQGFMKKPTKDKFKKQIDELYERLFKYLSQADLFQYKK